MGRSCLLRAGLARSEMSREGPCVVVYWYHSDTEIDSCFATRAEGMARLEEIRAAQAAGAWNKRKSHQKWAGYSLETYAEGKWHAESAKDALLGCQAVGCISLAVTRTHGFKFCEGCAAKSGVVPPYSEEPEHQL